MTLELVQDSLLRRMRTMHSLYYQAVGSMDLSHVNHFERAGVLPIAFSLFHYTNMHDASYLLTTNERSSNGTNDNSRRWTQTTSSG